MTWIALCLFGLAIALWYQSHTQTDEVHKIIKLTLALVSLMTGLAIAPLVLKFVSLIALLVYPVCTATTRVLKPDCPRFCLLRHQCKPSHPLSFPRR
jgi:uncharacterized membrane protein